MLKRNAGIFCRVEIIVAISYSYRIMIKADGIHEDIFPLSLLVVL